MDLQKILDEKVKQLPDGKHHDGLRAVKSHIESAHRHLARGQKDSDETLFTDAVYRCNQAFEGSVKEAYRVLAGKNPEKKTPAEIEHFLITNKLLRKRVLDQLTNYRKDWRNPSTHDYMLDFDEDEALLAIVSVTVFSIVLCDQIDSKIAFDEAAMISRSPEAIDPTIPLIDQLAATLRAFATSFSESQSREQTPKDDYYRLEGAVAGHLSAELSGLEGLSINQNVRMEGRYEADIVVQRGSDKVVIEIKRTPNVASLSIIQRAVLQVGRYLEIIPDTTGGLVLIYSPSSKDYAVTPATQTLVHPVKIVAPIHARLS